MLWQRSDPVTLASLEALLGKRRTAVLVELGSPRSTTELGRRLGLSAPSVSQHLSVLRGAGIVRANRVGRAVLCSRTAVGDALVAAGAPAHSGQLM